MADCPRTAGGLGARRTPRLAWRGGGTPPERPGRFCIPVCDWVDGVSLAVWEQEMAAVLPGAQQGQAPEHVSEAEAFGRAEPTSRAICGVARVCGTKRASRTGGRPSRPSRTKRASRASIDVARVRAVRSWGTCRVPGCSPAAARATGWAGRRVHGSEGAVTGRNGGETGGHELISSVRFAERLRRRAEPSRETHLPEGHEVYDVDMAAEQKLPGGQA